MNQTLMKIEVHGTFTEGGGRAVTYSHFRPGAAASRRLLEIQARDGLLSDYIISGILVKRDAGAWKQDCLLALMNIEFDHDTEGKPILELFGPKGFMARRELDPLTPLGCRYHWLSDLFPLTADLQGPLSVRLLDEHSITILSALHVDFARHQLSIDHGSDRFSTYLDYSC